MPIAAQFDLKGRLDPDIRGYTPPAKPVYTTEQLQQLIAGMAVEIDPQIQQGTMIYRCLCLLLTFVWIHQPTVEEQRLFSGLTYSQYTTAIHNGHLAAIFDDYGQLDRETVDRNWQSKTGNVAILCDAMVLAGELSRQGDKYAKRS